MIYEDRLQKLWLFSLRREDCLKMKQPPATNTTAFLMCSMFACCTYLPYQLQIQSDLKCKTIQFTQKAFIISNHLVPYAVGTITKVLLKIVNCIQLLKYNTLPWFMERAYLVNGCWKGTISSHQSLAAPTVSIFSWAGLK